MNIYSTLNEHESRKVYCIDASSLRLLACPQKFINTVVRGLKLEGEKNFKPAFGIAFHKYKAHYLDTKDHLAAMALGAKYFSTVTTAPSSGCWSASCLAEAMLRDKMQHESYQVLRDKDGKGLVEQKFKIPIYEDTHCVICISGTIDMLAVKSGNYCFGDHKVTQSWSPDEFTGKFILDHQMMLYSYVLDKLAQTYDAFKDFRGAPCFINMIRLTATTGLVSFHNSALIQFPAEHILALEEMIKHAIGIILDYLDGHNPMQNFSNCSVYGNCTYFNLCAMGRAQEQFIIDTSYITKPYDPLKFDEEN